MRQILQCLSVLVAVVAMGACQDEGPLDPLGPVNPEVQVNAPATLTVAQGTSVSQGCTISGTTQELGLSYFSSDTSIAQVNSAGIIRGRAPGEADVTCVLTQSPSVRAVTRVTVSASPAQVTITVSPTSLTLNAGDTSRARATVGGTTNTGVTWRTGSGLIASVDSSGLVRGVGGGNTFVTAIAKADTTKQAVIPVAVNVIGVTSITLSPREPSVAAGQTVALDRVCRSNGVVVECSGAAYSSSNTSIATVSSSAVVTGQSAGAAFIRAVWNNVRDSVRVTVTAAPAPVRMVWAEDNGRFVFYSDTGYRHRGESLPNVMGVRGSLFGGWSQNHSTVALQYDSTRRAWVLDLANADTRSALLPFASTASAGGPCHRYSPVAANGTWYKIQEHRSTFGSFGPDEPGRFVHTTPDPLFAMRIRRNSDSSLSAMPIAGASCS